MSQSERLLSSSHVPVDKVELVVIPRALRSSKTDVHYSSGPNEEPVSVHPKPGSTGGVIAGPSGIVLRVSDPSATPLPPSLSSASSSSRQSSPFADSPLRNLVLEDTGAVPLAVSRQDLSTPPLVVPHRRLLLIWLIFQWITLLYNHWLIQSHNQLSIIPWGSLVPLHSQTK